MAAAMIAEPIADHLNGVKEAALDGEEEEDANVSKDSFGAILADGSHSQLQEQLRHQL